MSDGEREIRYTVWLELWGKATQLIGWSYDEAEAQAWAIGRGEAGSNAAVTPVQAYCEGEQWIAITKSGRRYVLSDKPLQLNRLDQVRANGLGKLSDNERIAWSLPRMITADEAGEYICEHIVK